MKIARILFAGAMFSSTIFAQQGDPGAAERFRAKFGRTIAARETTSKAPVTPAADHEACGCCHGKHAN